MLYTAIENGVVEQITFVFTLIVFSPLKTFPVGNGCLCKGEGHLSLDLKLNVPRNMLKFVSLDSKENKRKNTLQADWHIFLCPSCRSYLPFTPSPIFPPVQRKHVWIEDIYKFMTTHTDHHQLSAVIILLPSFRYDLINGLPLPTQVIVLRGFAYIYQDIYHCVMTQSFHEMMILHPKWTIRSIIYNAL